MYVCVRGSQMVIGVWGNTETGKGTGEVWVGGIAVFN